MTQVQQIPSLRLNDGVEIPQFGFGVFQVPPEDTEQVVTLALEAGYRHIDTAAAYQNEEGVGRAIDASGLRRDEVFLTTKVFNHDHGRDRTLRALDRSLRRLGFDYVDLYLIHWPVPSKDLYVENVEDARGAARRRPHPLDRRLELQPGPPRAPGARDEDHAVGQPGRAAPVLPAARTAPVPRRARHRDRGVEPARPGPRARRRHDRGDRVRPRQDARTGDASLAPAARQRRDPEVGDARADPREHRPVRLRALLGRAGPAREARPR